jgi:hypothetical protein
MFVPRECAALLSLDFRGTKARDGWRQSTQPQ